MCHLRGGQGAEKRKRASERAEFTVIELSVFCCVAAPQVATEMRKHFYKNVISLQTSFIYFIPFPCLCQSGSDRVNKTEPGSRLVHYCWIHNWPPSIDVSMSICLPSAPFFTLYKNTSPFFTFLPKLGDLHACQSDLLRKPGCLDGSPSHCLSVNVFFQ